MVNRRRTLSSWQHFHVNPAVVCVFCSIVLHPPVYCPHKDLFSASPASSKVPLCRRLAYPAHVSAPGLRCLFSPIPGVSRGQIRLVVSSPPARFTRQTQYRRQRAFSAGARWLENGKGGLHRGMGGVAQSALLSAHGPG